jgi:hypothetical protein
MRLMDIHTGLQAVRGQSRCSEPHNKVSQPLLEDCGLLHMDYTELFAVLGGRWT